MKSKNPTQKITPFLWFDQNALEAAKFYTKVFKSAKILKVTYYTEGAPAPAGSVMTVRFKLLGQEFIGLNGGPHFKFTNAVSFVVDCENQKEVDLYWRKLLSGGGKPQQCGWLTDKFGLAWQIVPTGMNDLFVSKDTARVTRVMEAMMRMIKIDIKGLRAAAEGKGKSGKL